MLTLFSLSVLIECVLLWSCAAQTVPTASPEEYSFIWRQPPDCTPGTAAGDCTYFVGIQRNEGDDSYLDFYLEGKQPGWVAIGFSETANMVGESVI